MDYSDKTQLNDLMRALNDNDPIGEIKIPVLAQDISDEIIKKQTPEVQEFIKTNILTAAEVNIIAKAYGKMFMLPTLDIHQILASYDVHKK